jgi:integrase
MGHGTIYRRPNGSWAGEITVDGSRRTAYARTQAECVAKLQALQAQAAGGLPAVDQRTQVGAYLTGWLEVVGTRVKPRSVRHYTYMVGLIRGQIGRVKLAKLSPADVESMLSRLRESGLSPQTCAHVRATLRVALRDAQRHDRVTRNAAQIAKADPVPEREPRLLSPEAAWGVLAAIEDPQLRRMTTVALHAGVRQGELLGLRWQDIDWENGELHVSRQLQRTEGRYELGDVKSRKSKRALPLTPAAVKALSDERDSQKLARGSSGWRREPIPDLVFETATGQPRSGSAVTHQFAAALAAAGLEPMHWHHLRHAFSGLMLGAGVEIATVSALLGHSSVALTARTYAGVERSLKHDATDRLARRLAHPERT